MIATQRASEAIPLGSSVPALTPHAISVSLPTWRDNVGYEEGDKRVVDRMETGYPRFFIHRSIQKLAALCVAKFGRPDELCILLPSPQVAAEGRDFLANQKPSLPARIVEFVICPSLTLPSSPTTPLDSSVSSLSISDAAPATGVDLIELQILLFDKAHWAFAKAFWQHTGDGISSRTAERALSFLGEAPAGVAPDPATGAALEKQGKNATINWKNNRHYGRKTPSISTPSSSTPSFTPAPQRPDPPKRPVEERIADENLTPDLTTYLEERYGRNLPLFNAHLAKHALKRRIAGGLLPSDEGFGAVADIQRGGGDGKKAVREEDVYLYPTGMSAIWHAHDIVRRARRAEGKPEGESVCYGFPYTDTLKILQKWGDGCHFLGRGGPDDVDALAEVCAKAETPILSLFCEFPSNPLLTSPDLVRLRKLADQYGFAIVIDETIGNFINVEVVQFADVVVSSLSKIFSGDANVMGGSLVLNPNGPLYTKLQTVMTSSYEDNYFPEDSVYMERNSRDYRGRIKRINDNTYALTSLLHSRSLRDDSSSSTGKAVKRVYYPRYQTPEIFHQARRTPTLGEGGYGGLFSLTFTSAKASEAFFDNLQCAKGPSLGTAFTLACPYTILAHYFELDWAAGYGVEANLVRVSVGEEDIETLKEWFGAAVDAAEAAVGDA
ncbi:putative cystathionine gamma-synthase [Dioszegia hungarica]|uniref:cystathionine gamma-synthase n=1 Tax=Dioszegia hungarica TaxID=4972 RepID=A0AA38LTE0_9TREE|nr:putative cystathionine gamma-synthase [Dioszegia hungarica]KAI9632491.1 putative cystathionine gamma-synthase [Dioszegia hungarica]